MKATAILAVAATIGFFGGSDVRAADADALKLNETVVKSNQRLGQMGQAFGAALSPLRDRQPVDMDRLSKAHQALQATVKEVRKEMESLTVPDSKSAVAFYASYQRFLASQDSVVNQDLKAIVEIVGDAALAPAEKIEKIGAIFEKIIGEENERLQDLQKSQIEFAQDHGILLQNTAEG